MSHCYRDIACKATHRTRSNTAVPRLATISLIALVVNVSLYLYVIAIEPIRWTIRVFWNLIFILSIESGNVLRNAMQKI